MHTSENGMSTGSRFPDPVPSHLMASAAAALWQLVSNTCTCPSLPCFLESASSCCTKATSTVHQWFSLWQWGTESLLWKRCKIQKLTSRVLLVYVMFHFTFLVYLFFNFKSCFYFFGKEIICLVSVRACVCVCGLVLLSRFRGPIFHRKVKTF